MSEFSDLFSMLVSSRDINVTGLAAYCGLDRSTMYKLLNGRRNPSSREQVLRISEFMNLNPLENRELLNAYLITRIGWDVFCRRTAVLEFILNFQNLSPVFPAFPPLRNRGRRHPNRKRTGTPVPFPAASRCPPLSTAFAWRLWRIPRGRWTSLPSRNI